MKLPISKRMRARRPVTLISQPRSLSLSLSVSRMRNGPWIDFSRGDQWRKKRKEENEEEEEEKDGKWKRGKWTRSNRSRVRKSNGASREKGRKKSWEIQREMFTVCYFVRPVWNAFSSRSAEMLDLVMSYAMRGIFVTRYQIQTGNSSSSL